MKVLELKTQRVIEVDNSYGARMFEHGLAVFAPPVYQASVKRPLKNTPKQEGKPAKRR